MFLDFGSKSWFSIISRFFLLANTCIIFITGSELFAIFAYLSIFLCGSLQPECPHLFIDEKSTFTEWYVPRMILKSCMSYLLNFFTITLLLRTWLFWEQWGLPPMIIQLVNLILQVYYLKSFFVRYFYKKI